MHSSSSSGPVRWILMLDLLCMMKRMIRSVLLERCVHPSQQANARALEIAQNIRSLSDKDQKNIWRGDLDAHIMIEMGPWPGAAHR